MLELLQIWLVVEVLGLLCFPLTFVVFHNLPDRGWAFSGLLPLCMLSIMHKASLSTKFLDLVLATLKKLLFCPYSIWAHEQIDKTCL